MTRPEQPDAGHAEPEHASQEAEAPEVELLHREEELVVANKPAHMAVHRGSANDRVVVMKQVRDAVGAWVYPVHRLDRPTSGALVFALSKHAARRLQKALQGRRVGKRYLALTRGIPPEEGVVERPLPPREGAERQPARTHYRRLHVALDRYALVEAWPETGRMHQIRRHLRRLSCPLVGDVRYGDGKHNRFFREHYGLWRLALHAAAITFPHPRTDEWMTVEAPLTPDLRGPFEQLGIPEELLR